MVTALSWLSSFMRYTCYALLLHRCWRFEMEVNEEIRWDRVAAAGVHPAVQQS